VNQEAVTLVDDLKQDTAERRVDLTKLRTVRATASTSVSLNSTVLTSLPISKPTLGERIKTLLMNLMKALEGDHDFHNYLGG
jgi:hypothetical protein